MNRQSCIVRKCNYASSREKSTCGGELLLAPVELHCNNMFEDVIRHRMLTCKLALAPSSSPLPWPSSSSPSPSSHHITSSSSSVQLFACTYPPHRLLGAARPLSPKTPITPKTQDPKTPKTPKDIKDTKDTKDPRLRLRDSEPVGPNKLKQRCVAKQLWIGRKWTSLFNKGLLLPIDRVQSDEETL